MSIQLCQQSLRDLDGLVKVANSDDYYTPNWIFDKLDIQFDLDVAAPKGGVDWLPAKNHFSIDDDGLAQTWNGIVWMNPPYSKPTPWVDKFLEHKNGIALLPFMKSKWFERIWNGAEAIVPLPINLKFNHAKMGSRPIYSPCFLASVGFYPTVQLKKSQIGLVR